MKLLILKDQDINRTKLIDAVRQVEEIYEKNTELDFTYEIEDRDFSNIQFEDYYGGNYGMNRADINKEAKEIQSKRGEEITDIVYFVHEDKWLPGKMPNRIWGWNIGVPVSGYSIQQCRFDSRNTANNVGTLYHELMHAADSFIYQETGKDINALGYNWTEWDSQVVHGEHSDFYYIRHKENQNALAAIAPLLLEASLNREKALTRRLTLLQTIIRLQRTLVVMLGAKPIACTEKCITGK